MKSLGNHRYYDDVTIWARARARARASAGDQSIYKKLNYWNYL